MTSQHERQLRKNQTHAEQRLWQHLRNRQLHGAKFRRQHPVGRHIVDFCCLEHKLIIELDGGHHADQIDADQRRTNVLNQQGYQVIRFWDHDVLSHPEAVLQQIAEIICSPPSPSPFSSPPRGRGRDKNNEAH